METPSIITIIKSKKYPLIILSVSIVCVIGVVILLSNINREPEFAINNLSTYAKNIPSDTKRTLLSTLYKLVQENTTGDIPTTGAMIRDGSFSSDYDKETKSTYAKFIIDISSLKQSYLAQYEWSDNNTLDNISSTSVMVSCLVSQKDIIYKDFHCKDEFSFDADVDDPYLYIIDKLPYSLDSSANTTFTIDRNDNKSLKIFLDKCDATTQKIVIQETKDWIKSFDIDPSIFTIKTSCN